MENKHHLYTGSHESISWHEILANLAILAWRKQKYIFLYDEDEEAVSAIVNEEVDIDTDDDIDLEIEELSDKQSEFDSDTSSVSVDSWNAVTMGNKKPKE